MFKHILILLSLVTAIFSQEITVFNERSKTTTAGQIDTSRTIDLFEDTQKFNGWLHMKLNYDSLAAASSDDSLIFFRDVLSSGGWVTSDTITWYVAAAAGGVFSSAGTIITTANKSQSLHAWVDPSYTGSTPVNIDDVPNQFTRFRKKSISIGNYNCLLIIQPW